MTSQGYWRIRAHEYCEITFWGFLIAFPPFAHLLIGVGDATGKVRKIFSLLSVRCLSPGDHFVPKTIDFEEQRKRQPLLPSSSIKLLLNQGKEGREEEN